MSRLERAREFRNRIDANITATRKLIRVDELSEDELIEMIDLYELYEVENPILLEMSLNTMINCIKSYSLIQAKQTGYRMNCPLYT